MSIRERSQKIKDAHNTKPVRSKKMFPKRPKFKNEDVEKIKRRIRLEASKRRVVERSLLLLAFLIAIAVATYIVLI